MADRPASTEGGDRVDSRLITVFLAAGWLLVTLGLWGWVGRPWWIWPLSIGIGLLGVGAAYAWGFWQLLKAKAAEPEATAGPRRASA